MSTINNYFEKLPQERREVMSKLRSIIQENLPKGFEEAMSYGMPGFVVPLSLYPDGYHCKKEEPLPFISMASQKNFIGLYHMGIYASPKLYSWFTQEYPKHCKYKLDMGKSCIRFKRMDDIPYDLIKELVAKMTTEEWIGIYEDNYKK